VDITCAIPALALYCTLMMSYYYLPRFPHSVSSLSVCEIELHRLDMMINVKKSHSVCALGRATTPNAAILLRAIPPGILVHVNIVAGHKFACSLDTAFNAIFGRWVGSSQKTS